MRPDGPTMTLTERDFRPVLRYYNDSCFHFDLTGKEAHILMKIFRARQRAASPDQAHAQHPADADSPQLAGELVTPPAPVQAAGGPAAGSAAAPLEAAAVPRAQARQPQVGSSGAAAATQPAVAPSGQVSTLPSEPAAVSAAPAASPPPAAPTPPAAAALTAARPGALGGASQPSACTAHLVPLPLSPVFPAPPPSAQPPARVPPPQAAATPAPRLSAALGQAPSPYSPTRAVATPFGQSTRPGLVFSARAPVPGQAPVAPVSAAAQVPFPGFATAARPPARQPPAPLAQLQQTMLAALPPPWAGAAPAPAAGGQQAVPPWRPQAAAAPQLPDPGRPPWQAPPATAALLNGALPPWQVQPAPASLPACNSMPAPRQSHTLPNGVASGAQLTPPAPQAPQAAAFSAAGAPVRAGLQPIQAPAAGAAPSSEEQPEEAPPSPPPDHLYPGAAGRGGLQLPDLRALAGAAAAQQLPPDRQAVLAHALRDALEATAALHRALRVISSVVSLPPPAAPPLGAGAQPQPPRAPQNTLPQV